MATDDSDLAADATVQRTDAERIVRLRLNRPSKLNALDRAAHAALAEHFNELVNRPDVSVVVLSGNGKSFSAGADVANDPPGSNQSMPWTERRHDAGTWQRLLELMDRLPQVTVASLHGHCYGGAAVLAASCDLRIADDTLELRIPELGMGIPLGWSGVPRLVREIGLPAARDLVMTARPITGDEAARIGFVQRLVPAGSLEAETNSLAETVAANGAAPLAMARSMFAAIAREQTSAAGWADPDLLTWSLREYWQPDLEKAPSRAEGGSAD